MLRLWLGFGLRSARRVVVLVLSPRGTYTVGTRYADNLVRRVASGTAAQLGVDLRGVEILNIIHTVGLRSYPEDVPGLRWGKYLLYAVDFLLLFFTILNFAIVL